MQPLSIVCQILCKWACQDSILTWLKGKNTPAIASNSPSCARGPNYGTSLAISIIASGPSYGSPTATICVVALLTYQAITKFNNGVSLPLYTSFQKACCGWFPFLKHKADSAASRTFPQLASIVHKYGSLVIKVALCMIAHLVLAPMLPHLISLQVCTCGSISLSPTTLLHLSTYTLLFACPLSHNNLNIRWVYCKIAFFTYFMAHAM